jgi:FMN reductase
MRQDDAPYFDGRSVGCIACAQGSQAAGATLNALRSIVHALRGWPTPLGVAINTTKPAFCADGSLADDEIAAQLEILAIQVIEFARAWRSPEGPNNRLLV